MNQFATTLAAWVADFYLLATLLLGVMLVARRVIDQPARRLAVAWGGVLSLLLLAVLVALPGWSVIHLLEQEEPAPPVVELAPEPPVVQATRAPSMPTFASEAPPEPAPLSRLPATPAKVETASVETVTEVAAPLKEWPVASIVATTFGAGTMAAAVWCLVGAWQLRRLVRRAAPAPAELADLLTGVGERQPVPRLRLSDELTTAVALGLARPTILLPTGFARQHDRESLRTALAHELAHIRNGDLWLVAALRLLMHLLWAHPCYWLVRRGVRLDQELLADAAAAEVTSRDSYAEQLVGWARQMPSARGPSLAGAVGLWETGSQLRQRIRLLLDERLMIVRSCSRGWKIAALALCAALGMALSLVTLEPRVSLADEPATPEKEVTSAADYPHLKAFEVRVVDPLGNPIEGAKVTPWALRSSLGHGLWRTPDDNPKEAPTVVTDSNGVATVPYPEYGGGIEESLTTSVTCRVIHPDFAEVSSEHIEVPGEATIEMRRGAIVRLTGLVDDEPVPPGELRALWSSTSFSGKASPDDEGHLVLPRLPAGTELIRLVRISDSAPVMIGRVIEVDLLEGGEYFLIGELKPTVTVKGQLSDNVPRPVRNGWVVATIITPVDGERGEDLWWRTHAEVAEDGTFELRNLPAGEPLQIIAGCDGFAAVSGAPPSFVSAEERQRPGGRNMPQTFVLAEAVNEVTVEMVPTATLEVHVVDHEGEPVEGVKVVASPNVKWWGSGSQIYGEYRYHMIELVKHGTPPDFSKELKLYRATTDARGVATITNVPAKRRGWERIGVFSGGTLGNPRGHEIAARPGETTRTTVTIDRSKLPVPEEAKPEGSTNHPAVEWPATLSGEIKDDQDKPIAGAKVSLTLEQIHEYAIGRWDEQLSRLEGTTDEEGRYEFDLSTWPELRHRPFLITLSATAEGHSDGKTWTWYSASDNKVGAGFGKLTLPRGRKVTGAVVDPDGKPVVGAVVTTIANYGNNMMHEPRTTREDGSFELMVSRDGSAQVWIASDRWAPKYVAIAKGQSDLGKIELEPGTALEGTVRDASGNPVAGCVVAMRSGYDGESSGYSFAAQLATKTDAEGHYRLPPARGGYKVYLAMAVQSDDRVDNRFVVGTVAPPLAIPQWHELSGDEATKQADFIGTEPVELAGTVRWRDGSPMPGVEVQASYGLHLTDVKDFGTGIWIDRALSDAEGKYTLKLPKGITGITLSCFGARDKEKKWHSAFVADGVEGIRQTEQFMDLQEMALHEGRNDLDWVLGEEEEKPAAEEEEKEEAAAISPEMSIVIAKHYMLLDGKTPITWLELEERIKQLDPPSSAQLHYWFTNGAYADGAEELWRVEHDRLRQEYQLGGYSMGSLSPRTGAIYDKLETLDDLTPGPARAVVGQVVDEEGKPVAGAEVLLVEPVDESVAYKVIGIYMVEGRLRNRLDDVVVDSDADGKFVHYPSTDDVQAYFIAMHPEHGFVIARQRGLEPTEPLVLQSWGTLKGSITPQEGYTQSASVVSVVEEADGWPTVQFHQMTVDRDPERASATYVFTTIPPDLPTTLQRSVKGEQGSTYGLPGKLLSLTSGEEQTEDIGPLTEEDRERLEILQQHSKVPYATP